MSVMTATESAPAASASGARSSVMPPIATSGQSSSRAPVGDAGKTLRRPGHRFQRGGVDGPERDIVGCGGKRPVQLLGAMRADADLHARGPDGGEVGGGQVLLAEMHEAGAEFDRRAPIVVDHQLAAIVRAER